MDPARAAVRPLTAIHDRRRAGAIGRAARLELVFSVKAGRTILSHAYAEPPLRAGRALPEAGGGVHVILASSAPGTFGGDLFEQRIVLERGARVRLTSQSALQVHPGAEGGSARMRSRFDLADETRLCCHWDPLIPFAGSRMDQRIEIHLEASARLQWSDALMAGREGRGERWQFSSLQHELRLTRGTVLEYLERYRLTPGDQRLRTQWVAGECCYFGSTLVSGPAVADGAAERLDGELARICRLHAAADRLSPTLLLVRLAAPAGPPFHDGRSHILHSLGDL